MTFLTVNIFRLACSSINVATVIRSHNFYLETSLLYMFTCLNEYFWILFFCSSNWIAINVMKHFFCSYVDISWNNVMCVRCCIHYLFIGHENKLYPFRILEMKNGDNTVRTCIKAKHGSLFTFRFPFSNMWKFLKMNTQNICFQQQHYKLNDWSIYLFNCIDIWIALFRS